MICCPAARFFAVKLTPGELIDQKYRILRMLGTGGMGSVYEAENTRVERRVAIKVMHKVRDQLDITRFEREARAAQIGSPNIVQVFDLGYLADGAPYMVMEYLAGESLGERLQRVRCLAPTDLLPIARQILDALSAAHRAGIIHRDLKPDNVFMARVDGSDQEVVKLLDFGISKFTDAARNASDVSLTRSGVAVGTPHFMSPEQVQGSKDLDFRTDLYSLGVIFYRCLSGQLPFESDDVAPLLVQILLESPKPLHELRPDIDPDLSALIAHSMARRADDRFQTAAEFRAALAEWEQSHSGAVRAVSPLGQSRAAALPSTGQLRTNASWSSTASELPESKRTLRNLALAAAFFLVGVGGLFLAYGVWSSAKPRSVGPVAANSGVTAELSGIASASDSNLVLGHNAPVPTVVPLASAPIQQAPKVGVVQPIPEPNRPNVNHVASALPPPNLPSAASPAPGVVAVPAKQQPAADDDPDNRHMSRGVH